MEKVGELEKVDEIRIDGKLWITCRCSCGNDHKVRKYHWNKKLIKSCGCKKYKNLIGKTFGRLTVIAETSRRRLGSTGEKYWLCRCICDGEIEVATTDLNRKKGTKSCGCLKKERAFDFKKSRLNRVYSRIKKDAKRKGRDFLIPIKVFEKLIDSPCFYCGTTKGNCLTLPPRKGVEPLKAYYMGIDRKDSSKTYMEENCVPCCFKCNTMKNRKTFVEYLENINDTRHRED